MSSPLLQPVPALRARQGRRLLQGALVLSLCAAVVASEPPRSTGQAKPIDLLTQPAPATVHGARKLLTDIAQAGNRLVAVGEAGLALFSDDEGKTWRQAPTPTSVMLTSVSFATDKAGWAVGHDGVILATRDGGNTWQRQLDGRQADPLILTAVKAQLDKLPPGNAEDPSPQRLQAEDAVAAAEAAIAAGPSRPLLAVRFFDADRGLAAGAFGQLFQTTDGGKQWAYIGDRLDNPEGLHLNGLTLTRDGQILIAAENGTVFASPDQGRTWTRSATGYNGYLYGVLALPGSGLTAYGFNGHVFRSVDGGANWKPVNSHSARSIVAAEAIPGGALLLNEEGQVLVSRDEGATFKPLGQRLPVKRLSSVALLKHNALVTVGLGGAAVHSLDKVDLRRTAP
ncbi:MAG: YCF48-related protein [Pseudomonadota bacterium]